MASSVESIEIVRFDLHHPVLSPDVCQRPFVVKSVGIFAVLKPNYDFFVAVNQGQNGWSIPAGRVESTDSTPVHAALREFHEETGGGFGVEDITHMGLCGEKLEIQKKLAV